MRSIRWGDLLMPSKEQAEQVRGRRIGGMAIGKRPVGRISVARIEPPRRRSEFLFGGMVGRARGRRRSGLQCRPVLDVVERQGLGQ